MPAPYSQDLRERAVALLEDRTHTAPEVARLLQVGESTLYEWLARKRSEGSVAARPHAGGKVSGVDPERLTSLVIAENDLTLEEYAERYAAQTGRRFHPTYLCRVMRRLQLPRKSQSAHRSRA